jgi:hypothetical protein
MNEFYANFERLVLGKFVNVPSMRLFLKCSGHHMRFTRARSPARSWAEAFLLLLFFFYYYYY